MLKASFCRGHSPLSGLICALTQEDVSHVVLEYEGYVLQSNLLGVHWDPLAAFEEHASILRSVELKEDLPRLLRLTAQYANKANYDLGGLLYMGLRFAARDYLGLRLPKKNLWAATGMFLCTEWVTEYTGGIEDSLVTPGQLYTRLKGA